MSNAPQTTPQKPTEDKNYKGTSVPSTGDKNNVEKKPGEQNTGSAAQPAKKDDTK